MAYYSTLRWQFWLYLLRLVSFLGILAINTYSTVSSPYYVPSFYATMLVSRSGCLFLILGAPIVVIVNDVALLVWDANFCGSVIATACFQVAMSLFVVVFLILTLVTDLRHWQNALSWFGSPYPCMWPRLAFEIISMIATLVLIMKTFRACRNKPIRGWMQGVKELAIHIPLNQSVSIFGKRRQADDRIRIVWAGACSWGTRATIRFLKLGLTRRVSEVETLQYTLWRNLTALVLTCILFIQSIRLFLDVIHGQYEIKATWDDLSIDVWSSFRLTAEWQTTVEISMSIPNVSLFSEGARTTSGGPPIRSITLGPPLDEDKTISIILIGGPDAPPSTKIWLLLEYPSGAFGRPAFISQIFAPHQLEVRSFTPPVKLANGNHIFGSLSLAEHRIIQPSFAEMMGVSAPRYVPMPLIIFQQTNQLPSENSSIARATLTWHPQGSSIPVFLDRRQLTFLDALGSIGGLLAVLQGIHVLLFGQPLWLGLFGSKIIDPFGLCGARSTSFRKRMIARYGYISTAETVQDGSSTDRRLGLFLNDFVMDMGLLVKRDEEIVDEVPDEGEGVSNQPDSPSRDVDIATEGGDTGISTERRDAGMATQCQRPDALQEA